MLPSKISSELEAQLEIYLKMFALLYAEDTVLMSETSDGLQTLLNNFYEYSKLWKLKVNIDITKIMCRTGCFASSEVLICRISNVFFQLHNYH
jgi:hypothetical protein